jgi:hypothetical protein
MICNLSDFIRRGQLSNIGGAMKSRAWMVVSLILIASAGCTPVRMEAPEPPGPFPTPTRVLAVSMPTLTPTFMPVPTASLKGLWTVDVSAACQTDLENLRALRESAPMFNNALTEKPQKPGEFDPNDYFDVFPHLSLVDGYSLDYVYTYDRIGAEPFLYARQADAEPWIVDPSIFFPPPRQSLSENHTFGERGRGYGYLEQVKVDGSPESYLEYVLLATLGDQFYLYWHALYHDRIVLCGREDIQLVEAEMQVWDLELPEPVYDRLKQVDFTPRVRVERETVAVRFVSFSKWGGFTEQVYVLDRDDPFNIVEIKWNVIIPFEVQLRF